MNFKSNLNELTLLANEKIVVRFDDKTVEILPPSIRLLLLDLDFQEFFYTIQQSVEDFNKIIQGKLIIESKLGVLKTILFLFPEKKETFLGFIKKLFPNVEIKDNNFLFQGKNLTNEEYEVLLNILDVSCGEKPLKDFKVVSKKPVNSKQEEMERKIQALKNKNKKDKKEKNETLETSKNSNITIDQIVIGILYEFPGFTLDRIYDMNMFTLLHFWSYVSKVVDNQIQIVAAGNGHIKKFTYFIN